MPMFYNAVLFHNTVKLPYNEAAQRTKIFRNIKEFVK